MPADVLVVFVKAPEPGCAKTRLAAAIGPDRAATLYRRMGRGVVEHCVAPERYRTIAWFTPAGVEAAVRTWLGGCGADGFRCQPEGGLGARLSGAFDRHFTEGAQRVVIIGSDCPGVGARLVRRAFQALARADLVIGPALDGGFYLLGLNAPAPGLFRDVQWSTGGVYGQVLENAARLRLSSAVLHELRDVDTLEDALALGLLADDHHPTEELPNGTAIGPARRG